jgi:translation initiation factor 2 beta subunit (eIF-2beta)/eIF-5
MEKAFKKKEKDIELERDGHKEEISNFKKIIEEMERDYKRMTSHKKSL